MNSSFYVHFIKTVTKTDKQRHRRKDRNRQNSRKILTDRQIDEESEREKRDRDRQKGEER